MKDTFRQTFGWLLALAALSVLAHDGHRVSAQETLNPPDSAKPSGYGSLGADRPSKSPPTEFQLPRGAVPQDAAPGESAPGDSAPQGRVLMDNEKLDRLLREYFGDDRVQGRTGAWQIRPPQTKNVNEQADDENPFEREPNLKPSDRGSSAEQKEESGSPKNDGDRPVGEQEASPEDDQDPEGVNPQDSPDQLKPGERLPLLMIVLTDERADRMRVMMPIQTFDPNRADDLRLAIIALHANYDRALDARYAVQNGVLWSVFIHPLGSMAPADLENALQQVQTLRANTGTSFTSSGFLFGPVARPGSDGNGDDGNEA